MKTTFEQIWKRLSGIDVQSYVQQKGDFNYLPWSYAWRILMENFPQARYEVKEPVFYEDGTAEVWTSIIIDGNRRSMWLPILNYSNQAVKNPSSLLISNARMRCLVKCIGMFGLGHYIYAGEDLPELRGQTTGELLNWETIAKAYGFFKQQIDADSDDFDYQRIQDAEANLQSLNVDYMVEVMNKFGKEKPEDSKRQYKNILADILKQPLDAEGNPIREDAA